MAKQIQLIAVIPKTRLKDFVDRKKLESLDSMPMIDPRAKSVIQNFIQNYTGYDKLPIACLSRFNGNPGSIEKIGTQVGQILTTSTGSTLWELQMPDDMVVSINFSDLMTKSNEFSEATSEDEIEMLTEDLEDLLVKGYLADDDVISFIPFLDYNRCKIAAVIDNSWGTQKLNLPGIEQVKLFNLNNFQ